jgi:hypothetical protein
MISSELIEKALKIITSSPSNYQYFFDNLDSPHWIPQLRQAGRFKKPAQVLTEQGGIRFPAWPESRYLVRMAERAPDLVRDVIIEAEHTDNETVHQDYVEAALKLPVQLSGDIAKLEAKWIRTRERLYTLYPERVGDLTSYLAEGGVPNIALTLARSLLRIRIDEEASPEEEHSIADEMAEFAWPSEPIGRFDQWHYSRILQKNLPDITRAAPEESLRFIADLLEAALKIHSAKNHTPDEDYSWIWRPDIAHERRQDLKDAIVSAARDAALQMSTTSEATARATNLLLGRRWRIFRRLAAFTLDKTENAPKSIVTELLTRGVEYEDFPSYSPEFGHLLSKSFGPLSDSDREAILAIIDAGPNLSTFRKRREDEGNPATDQELTEIADKWRVTWLRRIADCLPPLWQTRYAELVRRLGEPSVDEPAFKSGGSFVGPNSPKSESELRKLDSSALIALLREWQPDGSWNGPSLEGLGRALSAMLSVEPERLSSSAERLCGLDPTYVRSALEGFREAVKNGKEIAWHPVLALCEWVVAQPIEIPGRKGGIGDRDPDWSWSRSAVVSLIHQGLQEGTNSIHPSDREQVWKVISTVLNDPDPYDTDGRSYGGAFVGSLSLNTPRGIAIDAVIDYAVWIRKHRSPELSKDVGVFSEMPEVQIALEEHLFRDLSQAVREVYGRRFAWLVFLDKGWATANVDAIFGQRERDLGQVAWANYVLFNLPYDDLLPILRGKYHYAIDTIGKGFRRESEDVDRRLAEHLMNLFWRGKLSLKDGEGLITQFFVKAPDTLRGHATWFVGKGLYDEHGTIPSEILQRLMELWEWRLSATRKTPNDREAIQFGYWFASGKFELSWAMSNLLEVLRTFRNAEPDHLIVEQLMKHAEALPLEAVQALGFLIEGDREGFSIYGWQEYPRNILTTAIMAGGKAKEEADRVIDLLGARGHYGYRDLLKR